MKGGIIMGKMTIRKTDKKCALCKHWNGTIGSTTIVPMPGGMAFQIDHSEKQMCYKKAAQTLSTISCPKFEPRY